MPSKTSVRAAYAFLFIAAVLGPGPTQAQQPSTTTAQAPPPTAETPPPTAPPTPLPPEGDPPPHGRVLNGHTFMPALDVPGALLTTSFTSALLVGLGQTSASVQISDKTLSGNFEYAAIGAVIGYEYAFLDYFSARLALTELLFTGINGRSAIAVGTGLQGGIGGGLTFSLPVADSLRLGVLFDASVVPNFGLTIGNGVRSIIEACRSPQGCDLRSGDFFQQKSVTQVQPALAASWAPFSALGVTANASYIWANQHLNGSNSSGNAFQLGTALDFDFKAISEVPVGLMFQFSWIAPFNGEALQHVSDIGGGIFYTGRKNLALGAQVIDRRYAVVPGVVNVTWKTFLVDIGMRYYW
jgi:hypothetical protein